MLLLHTAFLGQNICLSALTAKCFLVCPPPFLADCKVSNRREVWLQSVPPECLDSHQAFCSHCSTGQGQNMLHHGVIVHACNSSGHDTDMSEPQVHKPCPGSPDMETPLTQIPP
uniref:Uncharacterized protein n=1 Tax=Anguilla anguilla TaxID=7936 RepID=A0A0E9X601_ANGAN